MFALVTSTLLSIAPTTSDTLAAFADLTTPDGTPTLVERSPRARVAAMLALHALGGLDADARDWGWFAATLPWESEVCHARRIVAVARSAPVEDWLPSREWFAVEAAAYSATADAWRARAAEYRARIEWEADRSEELATWAAWAAWMESVACGYGEHACRLARWSGASWQCPRAIVRAEVREWMGDRWEAREWPK